MKSSADVVLTYGPPYGCVTAVPFYKISLSLSSDRNSSPFHTAIKRLIKKQVTRQATLSLLIKVLNSLC